MWKKIIGENGTPIIVINRFFQSILASSCGTTMADFIGPYGKHALNPLLLDSLKTRISHFPYYLTYYVGKTRCRYVGSIALMLWSYHFYREGGHLFVGEGQDFLGWSKGGGKIFIGSKKGAGIFSWVQEVFWGPKFVSAF